jgi:hypothetical protein
MRNASLPVIGKPSPSTPLIMRATPSSRLTPPGQAIKEAKTGLNRLESLQMT